MTTATKESAPRAQEILRRTEELAPTIAERAADTEAARTIPADVLDEFRAAGCFRLTLPSSHGGASAPLPVTMAVMEVLGRADPAVGWTVAIGASIWVDIAGLPQATFDAVYDHPGRIVAGAIAPTGTSTAVPGGYRVAGRWGFVSGCRHADWLSANTMEDSGGGEPSFRTVVFRPAEVAIEDSWHVLGIRGTASHHIRAEGVVVPAERTFPTFAAIPSVTSPYLQIPVPSLLSLTIASVALGAARGALDAVVVLAADKVPLFGEPLVGNRLFQREVARVDTELRAARALSWGIAEELWACAEAGRDLDGDLVAQARAAATWSTTVAVGAAEMAFRQGGGAAVYDDSPLPRRLRDLETIAQHFLVRPDTLTTAGAAMLGQPLDTPVF